MTHRYVLAAQARQDLAEIAGHIAENSGLAPAEQVVRELQASFRFLAEQPGAGHTRADLTDDPTVRFWRVYSYLVVFVSTARPIAVVSILHGARDPEAIAEHIRKARVPRG